jgi:hypothetical protein
MDRFTRLREDPTRIIGSLVAELRIAKRVCLGEVGCQALEWLRISYCLRLARYGELTLRYLPDLVGSARLPLLCVFTTGFRSPTFLTSRNPCLEDPRFELVRDDPRIEESC